MSDATDAIVQTTGGPPRPGHNIKGEEVVWERWTKKRVFVRALEGTYRNAAGRSVRR